MLVTFQSDFSSFELFALSSVNANPLKVGKLFQAL